LIPLQTGEIVAIHTSLLFFCIYFILLLNLFSFIFAFRVKNSLLIDSLYDLRFLYNSYPFIGILLAITLLSFAGIPPLAGFFSKFLTLLALYEGGSLFTALFVLSSSAISTFFYLDFIIVAFSYKESYAPINVSPFSLFLILITSLINIAFILYFPILNYQILSSLFDLFDPWVA